jgi:uridine kinase
MEPAGAPRAAVLARIADRVVAARAGHPTRVAIDGITAAGKTTFARELVAAVAERGRPAVHVSTDDFHHVAARRHRNPDRAVGYYRDAYDLELFRRFVLDPLGPGGDLRYRPRAHDLVTDLMVDDDPVEAAPDTVLVVDGSFLQSAVLDGAWDEVVWLAVSTDAAVERAVPRDSAQFGGAEATRAAYTQRYHAACALYIAERSPALRAGVVVDHDDLDAPVLRRVGTTDLPG